MELKYYVLNWDSNSREVVKFNIFRNWVLEEAVIKEIRKYLRAPSKYKKTKNDYKEHKQIVLFGFEAFCEEIRSLIMWQEWSRVEYEISVGEPFPDENTKFVKTDCYSQCEPNIPMIAREVIHQYKEQIKNNRDNDKAE